MAKQYRIPYLKSKRLAPLFVPVSLAGLLGFGAAAPGCSDDAGEHPTAACNAQRGAELYAKSCAACHGISGEGAIGKALNTWAGDEHTLIDVIDKQMPPADPNQCDAACACDIAAYIVGGFASCKEGETVSPRRLRLLTRREYNATVRDLFQLAASSPCQSDADCDIKSQSCVAGACEADPCSLHTFVLPANGQNYTSVHAAGSFNNWPSTIASGGWPMIYIPSQDIYVGKHVVPDGSHQYKFVINESNWISDPGNPMTADDGFGGKNSLLAMACAGSPSSGGATGFGDIAKDFPLESRPKGYGFDNNADAGLVTSVHVEQYMRAAENIAQTALQNMSSLVPCDPSGDAPGCADTFIRSFGKRAFRRPITDTEVNRYKSILLAQPDFKTGVSVVLQIMLSSPYFLYRFEIGAPASGGTYRLTPYETASALSYNFWGTMPDSQLFEAAENGELQSPAGIESQARRLLADPRSRELMGTFALQWLGVESIGSADKSGVFFPNWNDSIGAAMASETRQFINHVIFDSSGKFDELFSADYSFVNDQLAGIYGLSSGGSTPTKTLLPPERQAGIISQGSVLASYSHSDQSSPVRRGVFVREHLLCQQFATPPPNAGGVPDIDPNATTRERFRQHSSDPACRMCHQYIDEVGFGFEQFDAIGQFRAMENNLPVDGSGSINDIERLGSGTTANFSTLPELASLVAGSDAAKACFTRQTYRFAMGYLETPADLCALSELQKRFAESGYDIRELLISIVTSQGFTERK